MTDLMRDLMECCWLAVAVAGAALLFGPVALLVGGLAMAVFLEVTDGSS